MAAVLPDGEQGMAFRLTLRHVPAKEAGKQVSVCGFFFFCSVHFFAKGNDALENGALLGSILDRLQHFLSSFRGRKKISHEKGKGKAG